MRSWPQIMLGRCRSRAGRRRLRSSVSSLRLDGADRLWDHRAVATEDRPHTRPGGWGNRDFYDEGPRRRRLLERGATSAIVTLGTFVVMMLAIAHESSDCGVSC